ncbi:hypothetical protein C8D77_13211 [Mesorhizobium loti]|uniref:Uncharacterized protein n=2 Tax=Rhizobium loti TaxID=381 RepID=A0A8E2W7F2_RHILI|nr:hypothetical protein C8D77_13211 [Mesorhizobium loti]
MEANRQRGRPASYATIKNTQELVAERQSETSELLSRLQAEYPGDYPDKLLRALKRRLKVWRSEQADALLFGPLDKEPPILEIARPH